jgi:hypothetical protein
MNEINVNKFSEKALQNLKEKIERAFAGWKNVEIISHSFFERENESIFSETHLFANDYVHKITLKFHKNSDSWSREPNSIEHLGIKRPV